MVAKAALMGTSAKARDEAEAGLEGRLSRTWIPTPFAKRGVKHHHQPTPRLRFVPHKEEPAANEGAFLLDLSLIGGRLHH
jgi:hypothetical protein